MLGAFVIKISIFS